MSLRWYEGSATATTRTVIAEVGNSVEYHLVIGQTLATLVRVGDENTALACGDPDEMRARAEEFAAAEEQPPADAGQRFVFEPPAPATPTLSAAAMVDDLPSVNQIETQVDEMIKT